MMVFDPHGRSCDAIARRCPFARSARSHVASFLARAVADEILPPSVLRNAAFQSLGGEIVIAARRLLSR